MMILAPVLLLDFLMPFALLSFTAMSKTCSSRLWSSAAIVLRLYVVPLILMIFLCFWPCIKRGLYRCRFLEDPGDTALALEKVPYREDIFEDGNIDKHPESCPICLENFAVGQDIVCTPCPARAKHVFHQQCLSEWMRTTMTCPLCRHDMTTIVPVSRRGTRRRAVARALFRALDACARAMGIGDHGRGEIEGGP